jgi:hypothetical protein
MILHQGAGDMDNRYFPGKHRPETMPFGIGCSFKSRHFGFDFILVWRMPTPVWPGWQHSRQGRVGQLAKLTTCELHFF